MERKVINKELNYALQKTFRTTGKFIGTEAKPFYFALSGWVL